MAAYENLDYDKHSHSFRLNYKYCENVDDGQGITLGYTGFTTDAGDAMTMLKGYTKKSPHNPFVRTKGLFKCLKSTESGNGLAKVSCFHCHGSNCRSSTLCNAAAAAWKHDRARYKRAQEDHDLAENYKNMQKIAKKYRISLPLSQAFLYDSCVNHDCSYSGNDVEGFIVKHALRKGKKVGTSKKNQIAFFNAMLNTRKAYMHNPNGCDCAGDATWRIPGWNWLGNTKKYWNLPSPMAFKPYQNGNNAKALPFKCNPKQHPGCGSSRRANAVAGNSTMSP
jgi:chitosanase